MTDTAAHTARPARLRIGPYRVDSEALSVVGPAGTTTLEPKVMDVLLALAARPGEVIRRSELIEAVWAVEHGGDESLTRAVSILRRALGDVHGQRALIETVPRRGYRLLSEVTPDGPEQREGSAGAEAVQGRSRLWMAALAAAAVVLITAFLSDRPDHEPSTQAQGLVAVQPFAVAGAEAGLTPLAETLPTVLSTGLSQNGIRVVAVEDAGARGAQFLLGGAISQQGHQLRADVTLIDPTSGQVVWSDMVSEPGETAHLLPERLTAMTAKLLRCLRDLRSEVQVTRAEEIILLREICEFGQTNRMHVAPQVRMLHASHPNAPGSRALMAWMQASVSTWSDLPPDDPGQMDLREAAERMALDVLAEEPANLLAVYAMVSLSAYHRDWSSEEAWLRQAAQSGRPRTIGLGERVNFLRRTGRIEEATWLLKDVLKGFPASSQIRTRLGWLEASMGHFGAASVQFDIVERQDPGSEEFGQRIRQIGLFYDDPATLLTRISGDARRAHRPADVTQQCWITFLEEKIAGRRDAGRVDVACTHLQTDFRVRMFTQLGDLDRAFRESPQLVASRQGSEIVLFYPDMAPFRNDPRFWTLAADLGLAQYWAASGRWPDFCRDGGLPQSCKEGAAGAIRRMASGG